MTPLNNWLEAETLFPGCSVLWDIEVGGPVRSLHLSEDGLVLWAVRGEEWWAGKECNWCTFSNVAPSWHIIPKDDKPIEELLRESDGNHYPVVESKSPYGSRMWTDDSKVKYHISMTVRWALYDTTVGILKRYHRAQPADARLINWHE